MRNRWRLLLVASLALFACIDKGGSDPTVENGDPPGDSTVCPSCQQRAGGETADFGASPGGSSCASEEAPLTAEVEQAFQLAQLRAYLSSPHVVSAEPRQVLAGQSALAGPIEIKFELELGDFTYQMGERCSAVWAPVKLTVEVGDGQLSFSANGALWKQASELHAHLYASADLATATGSYRPKVDTNRPHAGQVEVSFNVFPDQLRGTVIPELIYFENDEQAMRYLDGDHAAPHDLQALVHLDFPVDECADHEWPIALDAALTLLGGFSPAELRRDVSDRLKATPSLAAVWRDDSKTVVKVEVSESTGGTVCARSDEAQPDSDFTGAELTLVMPVTASLRTEDGKIDMPLDKLTIAMGREQHELRWAALRGTAPLSASEKLDGSITYSFEQGGVAANGIVYFQREVTPGAGTRYDCVAFPAGSKWDTGECRYRR